MRAAAVAAALLITGCTRFARLEYTHPSKYVDTVSGIRLRPLQEAQAAIDLGSGARYDTGTGESEAIGAVGLTLGSGAAVFRSRMEVTIPDARVTSLIGFEVEF